MSSHTNLELYGFEVNYVQYQNMGKTQSPASPQEEDSGDGTLTKMKHTLYIASDDIQIFCEI